MQCLVANGGTLTDNHSDAILVAQMVARETLKIDDMNQAIVPRVYIGVQA